MAHLHRLIRLLAVMLLTAVSLPSSAEAFYSSDLLGGRCLPLDQVCSELDRYFEEKSKPSNWQNYQWHRLICDPPMYKGYRTGTLPDGRSVGGNNQDSIYGTSISKCDDCPEGQERQPDGTCKSKENKCPAAGESGPYTGKPYRLDGVVNTFRPCVDGCLYNAGDRVVFEGAEGAKPFTVWTIGTAIGGSCKMPEPGDDSGPGGDGDDDEDHTPVPEDDPRVKCIEKGMSFGEANGKIICVPKSGGGNNNNGGNNGNQGVIRAETLVVETLVVEPVVVMVEPVMAVAAMDRGMVVAAAVVSEIKTKTRCRIFALKIPISQSAKNLLTAEPAVINRRSVTAMPSSAR